jgi:phosphoribosylanthranilate isomerase
VSRKRRVKAWFLSFFREIFVYHNSSLEFRAKLLAVVIGANKDIDECEKELLLEVAKETYPDDIARVDVLVNTTKEFVSKIIENNGLNVIELILRINQDLKEVKRFHEKIDTNQLRRFLVCSEEDEETYITQLRIIEFLENSIRNFNKLR